jgi:hypothetical protein
MMLVAVLFGPRIAAQLLHQPDTPVAGVKASQHKADADEAKETAAGWPGPVAVVPVCERHLYPSNHAMPQRAMDADNYLMRDIVQASVDVSGQGQGQKAPAWLYFSMLVAAIGGGWTAVAIAILPALGTGASVWLLLFFVAPFSEEALKPLGVYFIFLRWPHVVLSRIQIALLAAAGGLTFAFVESWLYLDAYPDEGNDFVVFRFTAPIAMHVVSSFVLGLGLTPNIFGQLWRGPVPASTRQAYFSAVGIHATYNITVLLLAIVGARELVEQTGR